MTFDGTRPTFATLRTNSIVPVGGIPAGSNGGGIIQIKQVSVNSQFSTTSTSFVDVTSLSVSISPQSSSNKILVTYFVFSTSTNGGSFRILRGSTQVNDGTSSSPVFYAYGDGSNGITSAYTVIDSPGTTSSTTYKVQMKVNGGTGFTYARDTAYNIPSLILVQEISG